MEIYFENDGTGIADTLRHRVLSSKAANTRSVYVESCNRDATCDPVFFNGAVHIGTAKLCNQVSLCAYHPPQSSSSGFAGKSSHGPIVTNDSVHTCFFYESVFALPGWQLQATILFFKVKKKLTSF
ncbi:hypothetical protein AVEN_18364-1 [Araneus ventricosus]|uniref:Uncharacterized protein n=1 Tax=Araneus ventricosus TaxID=182803 RepID=A0A4Y2HQ19_ARAVE|nr:hypothetical protein AVEN_18364-1 [Araneus ventricosus]